MRRSILAVAVVGGVLSLVSLLFFGLSTAFSVGVGAALAAVNLWALARIVAALLPTGPAGARAQSKAAWGLLATIKLFGLIAVVWLLMRHGIVSPIPMVVGFGALPIGIAIGSLLSDRDATPDDEG
jgi:hypothetical protein